MSIAQQTSPAEQSTYREQAEPITLPVATPGRKSYFVMRDPANGIQRSCWTSPSTGALYCGVCLRHTVSATVGAACPSCHAGVEMEMEALRGGSPAPRRSQARLDEIARRRDAAMSVATGRVGKVVTLYG